MMMISLEPLFSPFTSLSEVIISSLVSSYWATWLLSWSSSGYSIYKTVFVWIFDIAGIVFAYHKPFRSFILDNVSEFIWFSEFMLCIFYLMWFLREILILVPMQSFLKASYSAVFRFQILSFSNVCVGLSKSSKPHLERRAIAEYFFVATHFYFL